MKYNGIAVKLQASWFVIPELKSRFLSENHKHIPLWIELDALNDAFGLLVSNQYERLHCLAVRGSGAAAVWPTLD